MIHSFDPPGVWKPFGAFALGVIQGEGQVVSLKGQVALDEHGAMVGAGDMRAQVRRTLENIRSVLASVGGRMEDVFSLVHYVTTLTGGDSRISRSSIGSPGSPPTATTPRRDA